MSLVEYQDPDNVFDLVIKQLQPRLPLTNLHWKSSSRPLRSISNLHVEFVSAQENHVETGFPHSSQQAAQAALPETKANKTRPNTQGHFKQRHQIPGLRQTPYLKLYLLRCDDKEQYKSKSRDLLQTWVKSDVTPTKGSSTSIPSDHDAFEWLILHVVLPDTPASNEPRWSKKNLDQDTPKERPASSTKWPGKGSRTILERLRADFNQSGKSAPDRIAQIRLSRDAISGEDSEISQDQVNAFNDLISKLKTLILKSFDLRISQYEEDVREKEEQKSLPGWNFCTFFVLKEGLARAFENVGLLEDALSAYDELDAGLDSAIRNIAYGQHQNHVTSFLESTPDIKRLVNALQNGDLEQHENNQNSTSFSRPVLDVAKKDYRALIVSNNISLYDLRCYMFARQMSILLKLTGSSHHGTLDPSETNSDLTNSKGGQLVQSSHPVRNVMALAEFCRRAVKFIPAIARILRIDVRHGSEDETSGDQRGVGLIDQLISLHTFSVAQQVLNETAVFESLIGPAQLEQKRNSTSRWSESGSATRLSLSQIPQIPETSGQMYFESWDIKNLKDVEALLNPELVDVASCRAQLYMIQKRALEMISDSIPAVTEPDHDLERNEISTIGLVSDPNKQKTIAILTKFWHCEKLMTSLQSTSELHSLIERLINLAAKNFALSSHTRSAEKLIVDLAKLKCENGDFSAAALYFNQALPSFSAQSWTAIESSSLQSYAKCLKFMNRKDEYVRAILALIAKDVQIAKSYTSRGVASSLRAPYDHFNSEAAEETVDLVEELASSSMELPHDVSTSLEMYFMDLRIGPNISIFEDRDGFKVALNFTQLLAKRLTIDYAALKLVNPADSQAHEITLETHNKIELGFGDVELWLSTHSNAVGYFIVERVNLMIGKVTFTYEPYAQPDASSLANLVAENARTEKKPEKHVQLLLYQRSDSLFADVVCSKTQYFGKMQSFDVPLQSGANEIESAAIVLRSATAGLRIYTAEAKVVQGQASILTNQRTGHIPLGPILPKNDVVIRVPYNLERNLREISVRLEVHYETPDGSFLLTSSPTVPLDVGVGLGLQVMFKQSFLYAKFLIQPEQTMPIRILDTYMTGSENFEAEPLLKPFHPFTVYKRQPVGVTYRINRKNWHGSRNKTTVKKSANLTLKLTCSNLQHDICSQILTKLSTDIGNGNFKHFEKPLRHSAHKYLPTLFPLDVCEMANFTKRFQVPSLRELGWLDIVQHASTNIGAALLVWLEQWHKANFTMELLKPDDELYGSMQTPCELFVDFTLPQLHYLYTASVKVDLQKMVHSKSFRLSTTPIVHVGEPIPITLKISHTRRWDMELKAGAQDFIYEIHADPKTWLLVGRQSARFSTVSDDEGEFSAAISLIPLKTGALFLPSVNVKVAQSMKPHTDERNLGRHGSIGDKEHAETYMNESQGEDAARSNAGRVQNDTNTSEGIQCQTDCTTLYSYVVAIAGTRSTSVGIHYATTPNATNEPAWEARLLSSQSWNE